MLNKLFRCLIIIAVLAAIAVFSNMSYSFAAEDVKGAEMEGAEGTGAPESEDEMEEVKKEEEEITLWGIIALGGKLMYVLAFLSFLTIVLITFYFLSLTPANAVPPPFTKRVREMLSSKKVSEAKMFCGQHENTISRILSKGLARMARGHDAIVEAMRAEGERQAGGLWQKISYLADIAVVAPMVGLLGTTIGMMHTFMEMRSSLAIGGVKPAAMASGIFEALVTTVAGLIIAIIATGFYAYFRGVVQRIVTTLEETTTEYVELIEGGSEK